MLRQVISNVSPSKAIDSSWLIDTEGGGPAERQVDVQESRRGSCDEARRQRDSGDMENG